MILPLRRLGTTLVMAGMLAACSQRDASPAASAQSDQTQPSVIEAQSTETSILPSAIQGKWALIYDRSMTLSAVCNDPDGKGVFEISNDRIAGYEINMKVLNTTGEVGTAQGSEWQAQVSMEAEGELFSDIVTIKKRDDGVMSIIGKNATFENLHKCV